MYKVITIKTQDVLFADAGNNSIQKFQPVNGIINITPTGTGKVKVFGDTSKLQMKYVKEVKIKNPSNLQDLSNFSNFDTQTPENADLNILNFSVNDVNNKIQTLKNAFLGTNLQNFDFINCTECTDFESYLESTKISTVKINSIKGQNFKNSYKNSSLNCIEYIDTLTGDTGAGVDTTDMFLGCNINNPDTQTQDSILQGLRFTNPTPCQN